MGAKGSDKGLRTTGSLTDWISGWTALGVDFRIQLTNLVTNWNKIANKPPTFPADGRVPTSIPSKWEFGVTPSLNTTSMENPGPAVEISVTEANSYHIIIEEGLNLSLDLPKMHESDFVVFIEQSNGGNHTLTLEPNQFAFGTVPQLSITDTRTDMLCFRFSKALNKAVLTSFVKGLQFS